MSELKKKEKSEDTRRTTQLKLKDFLEKMGIWYRFISKPETIHTADAAKVAGVDLKRLTKNLVSETDAGEHILLVIPGDCRVNLKAAAKALATKRVRLVSFNNAEEISGYPPGGTPTVGHKTPLKTVIDKSLLRFETIYCGGGSRDKLLELKTKDILKLTNAVVADIIKSKERS
ncbi:TPA: aminoacyl-tRNA deacylase [Candidatus Bathyarchaeota archaeon]|nr:aminoacyl-tRNA deacylase [Candidatus Bathyarchaeota archaeon]